MTSGSAAHIVGSSTVLVWGASPQSSAALYSIPSPPSPGGGGAAYALRWEIKEWLNSIFEPGGYCAAFSEHCDTYRHHPANAGLYEPFHLTAAGAVVLVLPGNT